MSDAEPQTSTDMTHQQPVELTGRQALLEGIGSKLSQSRDSSGESIENAVRKLKLQKSHLQALENGHWDRMPDDIYMIGFLRQYSQYLHVDLSDEIHRLKHEQYALTKPLTFPDPPVAPSRRWAWLAGGAFILLFILFNIVSENDGNDPVKTATSTLPPPVTAPTPNHPDVAMHTTSDNEAAVETTTLPASEALTAEMPPSKPAIKSATAEDTATVTAEETAPTKQVTTGIVPAADTEQISFKPPSQIQAVIAATQAQTVQTMTHHFRFDAVGSPVWLQIFLPNSSGAGKGRLMKEVLLQPGFHTSIHKAVESLWVTCGNAPALRIVVDGTVLAANGSLGAGKKILRDYRFTIASDN